MCSYLCRRPLSERLSRAASLGEEGLSNLGQEMAASSGLLGLEILAQWWLEAGLGVRGGA